MEPVKKKGNTTDHLANERTFLAWMRTSIGIMAFGFVVVKFSLFVKRISMLFGSAPVNLPPSHGMSAIVGIVLVLVGTITIIFSYLRYRQSEKQISEGAYVHSPLLITIISIFILIASLLLIAYLITSAGL
jgi:putative membrane protein